MRNETGTLTPSQHSGSQACPFSPTGHRLGGKEASKAARGGGALARTPENIKPTLNLKRLEPSLVDRNWEGSSKFWRFKGTGTNQDVPAMYRGHPCHMWLPGEETEKEKGCPLASGQ